MSKQTKIIDVSKKYQGDKYEYLYEERESERRCAMCGEPLSINETEMCAYCVEQEEIEQSKWQAKK